ncbi:MAG: tandem-95 repeat protein, partial [Comamonadaceae bacterium]
NGSDTFTVTISDGQGGTVQVPVNVTVNPVNDAPTGTAAPAVTNEDQPVNGTVVGADVDGDTLSYAVTTPAANGAVTIDPATGAYAYTPNANFNGSDAFTVAISDGKGGTVQVPVSVIVNAINDAPAGVDKTVTINEDTTYTFAAADFAFTDANDAPANALQSVIISTLPAAGQGQLLLNGVAVTAGQNIAVANLSQLTYVPAANANGSGLGSFTFQVVDNGGTANGGQNTDQSASAFSFNVNPVNDAPTGTAAPGTTNEDQPVNGTVAGTDVDGDTLSYAVTTPATNGTVTIDPSTGAYTYTPTANFNGSDTFTVTISDGQGGTVQVPVSVTINPVNDAPVNTVPGAQSVAEDTPLTIIGISVNDVDGNLATTQLSVLNGSLSVSLAGGATISAGANGSATLTLVGTQTQVNAALATLSYQGAANYNGSDTLTVRSTDSAGLPLNDVDTVAITVTPVNDTPVAVADSFTVAEGGTATTLNGGAQSVLFNDSDVDGDTLTAILVTGPVNGTLVLNANGTFSYTHNGSETTSDSFSYKVNDGTADGNTVTVSITVTEVDNAPVALDDLVTVLEDTPYTATVSLLANDTDVDGPSLSAVAGTFTTSQGGTIVIAADGSYTYTPLANFNGNDTVTYTVTDGTSSDTGTLTLVVQPVNDAPAGADKTVTINEDGTYTFSAADFALTDAKDTPAHMLQSVNITTLPPAGQGQLVLNGVAVNAGQNIAAGSLGQLTYVPAANANGNGLGAFTFQVVDNGGTANGGQNTDQSPNTFNFNVTPVNDAPAGTAAPATTNEDQAVSGTVVGFDVDGDTLSYAVTTGAANGIVTINAATGGYTYTPAANFNGSDTFTVTISDGKGGTVQVPVNVTISAVNDVPTGTAAPVSTQEDQAVSGTVVGSDVDGDTLSYSVTTPATSGTVTIAPATGAYTYTPAANFSGSDTFTVTISDGKGGTVQVPVSVTVNAVNDAPAGVDKTVTINEDATYTFTAADFAFTDANDTPANALQSVIITTLPAAGQGQLLFNGVGVTAGQTILAANIGQLTYVPAANANGNGLGGFTFQVVDNGGTANGGQNTDQSPNTFNFNVTPVNDAPAGVDKTVTVNEDATYTFTAADFAFTDANDTPANGLQSVIISTLPAAGQGQLLLNGVAVTSGQNIAAGSLGQLTYVPAANANGNGLGGFTFQVVDNGGTANGGQNTDPSPNTFNFNVTPVNDAPAGVDKTVTVNEDATYTFTAADFAFTDANDTPANTLQSVIINTLPAAGQGQLLLNGVGVTAGQTILATNIGQLTYVPAANANGNALGGFTFQVVDNGGTANGGQNTDQSPNAFNFNVTPVNDAPAGIDKTVTINEDATYTFTAADFAFTDANDTPANALQSVIISTLPAAGQGQLLLNGVAVTAGQNIAAGSLGQLTYVPAANANGNALGGFTFQVVDNGGTANGGQNTDQSPNTFNFNVTPVNDAPAGVDKTVTVNEDATYIFTAADFAFTDANDTPANALQSVIIGTLPAAGQGQLLLNGVGVTAGQT